MSFPGFHRWGVVLFLGFLLLGGCGRPQPPPGSAEAAFEHLLKVLEGGDVEALNQLMAPDFAGDSDRATTLAWANQWMKKKPDIRIAVISQEKQPSKTSVTFRSRLFITARRSGLPVYSSRIQLDTQWVQVQGKWKVRVAQWHRLQ